MSASPENTSPTPGTTTVRAIGGSPGYAVGRAFVLSEEKAEVPERSINHDEVETEIQRLESAISQSVAQVDRLLNQMKASHDGTQIIESHRLIMQDQMLVEQTRELIDSELINAEAALGRTLRLLEEAFSQLSAGHLQERSSDVRAAAEHILANLMGRPKELPITELPDGAIVVAHDLSPAEAIELTHMDIAGFALEVGGTASHTAIMARAMEIPAVVGATDLLQMVEHDQTIAVNGRLGEVIIGPDEATVERFRESDRLYRVWTARLLQNREQPAITLDGIPIRLEGNIEFVEEIDSLRSHGGEGIGLYRTEYLFLSGGPGPGPDEETQYREYRRIIEGVAPYPSTFRTLDIGADKLAEPFRLDPEACNPALGLRGVRLSLRLREVLKTQIRAIYRAAAHGPVRMMIPFVTGLRDVIEVKQVTEDARAELRDEGIAFEEDVPFGIMIEIPSAAVTADLLAPEVEFFSIGTNDLVQYTLAVDRDNETVAPLYRALHPAVLRLLDITVRAARDANIEVSICGEMAGDPFNVPVLIGCGFDALSMNPISIPSVKNVIRRSSAQECRALLEELKLCPRISQVEERLTAFNRAHYRDSFHLWR